MCDDMWHEVALFTLHTNQLGPMIQTHCCRILGLQPLIPFLQCVNSLGLRFVLGTEQGNLVKLI